MMWTVMLVMLTRDAKRMPAVCSIPCHFEPLNNHLRALCTRFKTLLRRVCVVCTRALVVHSCSLRTAQVHSAPLRIASGRSRAATTRSA
eukprot:2150318-Prymnesium_polylepis.1